MTALDLLGLGAKETEFDRVEEVSVVNPVRTLVGVEQRMKTIRVKGSARMYCKFGRHDWLKQIDTE